MREDTELKNFPLFCPKCRQEILIEITKFRITVITEPDAKTQSQTQRRRADNSRYQNLILSAFSFLCIPLSLVLDILYKKISVLIFFAVAVLQ